MKDGLIQLAKDLNNKISLEALKIDCFDDTKCSYFSSNLTKDDLLTVKILIAGMKIHENPIVVNNLLVYYAVTANDYNIRLIFKRINPNTPESLDLCKKYVLIPAYRAVVLPVFKRARIYWEDAHIYNILALEEYLRKKDENLIVGLQNLSINFEDGNKLICYESILVNLFKTINEDTLSITHKIIKRLLVYDISKYIPKLTDNGLANAIKYGITDSIKQLSVKGLMFSSSERVRTESFKYIGTFSGIIDWFKYNQYIEDTSNQRIIIDRISILLERLKTKPSALETMETVEFFNIFISSVIVPMCNSPRLCRRVLGANLLVIVSQYLETIEDYKPLINGLIYDKAHEVRDSVAIFCSKMGSEYNFPIRNFFSYHYYMILGATHYLKAYEPQGIFNLFKSALGEFISSRSLGELPLKYTDEVHGQPLCFDSNFFNIQNNLKVLVNLPIFGFIHYFTEMKYESIEFDLLVRKLYYYTIDNNDVLSWRTLKECCFYFYVKGNVSILMNTLLICDYFGIISYLKSILSVCSSDVSDYLFKGLACIREKKNNTRRSGGLSVYFSVLAKCKGNYWAVRDSLLNLLCSNWSSGDFLVFSTDESTVFHCLNSLISLIDDFLFDDAIFYFDLAFACLHHSSFNVRNCGSSIFATLVKKILQSFRTMEAFLAIQENFRKKLCEYLRKGISEENYYVVYFILVIYGRIENLMVDEITLISECLKGKELIALKAKSILTRQSTFNGARTCFILRFNTNINEKDKIFILFRMLDSGDLIKIKAASRFIYKEYHFGESISNEYLRHKLVEFACSKGYSEYFKTKICEVLSTHTSLSSNRMFDEEAGGDEPDIEYELSLVDLYSNVGRKEVSHLN